jgi:hypothetical protein
MYSVFDYFSILMKLSTNNINEGIAISSIYFFPIKDRINNKHRDLFTDWDMRFLYNFTIFTHKYNVR